MWYHNFIEASGFNPVLAEERFRRSVAFFTAYGKMYGIPIASNSIVPHAPYSVSDELWEKIIHFPGNHLLSIHNQEAPGENDWFQKKEGAMEELYTRLKMDASFFNPTGKTSLQSFLPKLLRNQSVILVHNIHSSAEDVAFAKQTGLQLHWCLCPNANLYIGAVLPDIDMLMSMGCDIVLGTDSLASNHELNILGEIKTIQKHYPHIPCETMLKWATSNGARALQLEALMGSFEKGKQPGVVLIEADRARRLI
jgi:cytosine/adenosine deaminase-related metal-dependent hydrolase